MSVDLTVPLEWKTATGDAAKMLEELQPNILKAHARDHFSALFLRFSEPGSAMKFLASLVPLMKSAKTHLTEVERFKSFYQHTLIPDEGFFQTVIMNTSYTSDLINDDKRAIDWIPMGDIKLRPRDYTAQDAEQLLDSEQLFARKFDETIDSGILDILEAHLASPLPGRYHSRLVPWPHVASSAVLQTASAALQPTSAALQPSCALV